MHLVGTGLGARLAGRRRRRRACGGTKGGTSADIAAITAASSVVHIICSCGCCQTAIDNVANGLSRCQLSNDIGASLAGFGLADCVGSHGVVGRTGPMSRVQTVKRALTSKVGIRV